MSQHLDTLWTFQDAVERVLDTFDVSGGRNLRQAKEAVLSVNRDLGGWHDWQWLMTDHWFRTSAAYDTGTIEYTASTRTATLTGGSWPSDAEYGELVIDNLRYPIESVSGQDAVLKSGPAPADDIAAGTSYRWVRTEYESPSTIRKNLDMVDRNTSTPWPVMYIRESDAMYLDRTIWSRYTTTAPDLELTFPYFRQPRWWTVGRNDKYDSGFSIKFAQVPLEERLYQATFWRDPRRLKVYSVACSDLTVAADDTAVTSATSVFTSDHVGALLRFSSSATAPTPLQGGIGTSNPVNPFAFQAVIESVASGTAAVLATAAPESAANVAGIISDPLDIDHELMLSMFLAAAEAAFAKRQRHEDWPNWDAVWRRELSQAKGSDNDFRKRGKHVYGAY